MRKGLRTWRSPVSVGMDQHQVRLAPAARASPAAWSPSTATPTTTAAIRISGGAPVVYGTRRHRRIIGTVEVGLVFFVDNLIGLFEVVATLDHDRACV